VFIPYFLMALTFVKNSRTVALLLSSAEGPSSSDRADKALVSPLCTLFKK